MKPRLLRPLACVILAAALTGPAALAEAEEPREGLVVLETPPAGSPADVGIRPGDVLLSWRRDGSDWGTLRWPSGLAEAESEQAPRGRVVLKGRRGRGAMGWVMPAHPWGLRVRPTLSEPLLAFYTEGAERIAARDTQAGVQSWHAAAQAAGDAQAAWFLGEIGRAWIRSGRWEEADAAFQSAVRRAESSPMIAHLLRDWGNAALAARRWDRAESCFRRALSLAPAGSFAAARDLAMLAVTATCQGDLDEAESLYRRALRTREVIVPMPPYLIEVVRAEVSRFARPEEAGGDRERIEELRGKVQRLKETLLADAGATQGGRVAAKEGQAASKDKKDGKEAKGPAASPAQAAAKTKPEAAREPSLLEKLMVALEQAERDDPGSLLVSDHWQDLGTLAFTGGDVAGAEIAWLRALDLREKLAPGTLREARTLHDLGGLHLREKRLTAATSFLCRAAGLLDWLPKADLESEGTRAALGVKPAAYDHDCVTALVESGRPDEAFLALERSHARAAGSPLAPEIVRRRREIEEEHGSDIARLARLSTSRDRDEVHLVQGHARYLEHQRGETVTPLSLPDLRAALTPGILLLAWTGGDSESLLFVVRPDGMQGPGVEAISVPAGSRTLRQKIGALASAEKLLVLLPEGAMTPPPITALLQSLPAQADRKPFEKTVSATAWTALRKQQSQSAAKQ